MRNMRKLYVILLKLFVVFIGGTKYQCDCYNYRNQYYYHRYPINNIQFDKFLENDATKFLCLAFGICATILPPISSTVSPFAIVNEWPYIDYTYSSDSQRQKDIKSGLFTIGGSTPIDMDVFYHPTNGSKIFVTVPRFRQDIPASLGIVQKKRKNGGSLLAPYPSWDWHTNPTQCKKNRIVSVFRIKIDECGRLWVLDTGHYGGSAVCPAQIIAFDLKTDKVVHRYEIPKTQMEDRSLLVNIAVDNRDPQCLDTFIYAGDCQAYSIIVHDVQKRTSWKITDQTMYPYPTFGTFNILGDTFHLMDGILGMALTPYKPGQGRILYYHAMSSPTENWVRTSDLRNQTRFLTDPLSSPEIFHTFKGQRTTQSAAEAMDRNGIMYFGMMADVTLDCWNTNTDYNPKNWDIIGRDANLLQFVSGVKVVVNPKMEEELWVMTCRFQKMAAGTMVLTETNFRILAGRIEDLVFSTKCKNQGGGGPSGNGIGGGYGLHG